MKPDPIQIAIAAALCALAVWGIVTVAPYEHTVFPLAVGSALTLGAGLMGLLGCRSATRTMVSAKVAAALYVLFAFVSNIIFAFFDFSLPLYVIVNGVPLLLFVLLWLTLLRASKQVG